jgi:transcriptional regulator with XRE-family HTH domain
MTNRALQWRDERQREELPLTVALQSFREKLNKSQAQIARDAWLDESYVSRLFSGQRDRPSRDAVILLTGFGMELSVPDVEEVLLAADYRQLVLPQSLR